MHLHTEFRLTPIIFKLVIWIIAISIVNTKEKVYSDEGTSEGKISPKIPNIGKSVHIEIYFHLEIVLFMS